MEEVDRSLVEKERRSGGDLMFGDGAEDSERREMLFSGAAGNRGASGGGGGGGSGGGYRAPSLGGNSSNNNSNSDMEMLIQNSESMLRESQALCFNSEQVGADTLFSMNRQREQLHGASDHLAGAREKVEQARVLLGSMSRKALRNKMFLYGIIGLLIVANFFVLVAIIKKKIGKGN